MKLARLTDWLKGAALAAPVAENLALQLEESLLEIERKENVIQHLSDRCKLAESMLIKYRRQRNQLKSQLGIKP